MEFGLEFGWGCRVGVRVGARVELGLELGLGQGLWKVIPYRPQSRQWSPCTWFPRNGVLGWRHPASFPRHGRRTSVPRVSDPAAARAVCRSHWRVSRCSYFRCKLSFLQHVRCREQRQRGVKIKTNPLCTRTLLLRVVCVLRAPRPPRSRTPPPSCLCICKGGRF